MGLYDGAGTRGTCGNGSTADLAALTGWPVVLVLDVGAQAETAAAIAQGLTTYRRDIDLRRLRTQHGRLAGHAAMIARANGAHRPAGVRCRPAPARHDDAGTASGPRTGRRDVSIGKPARAHRGGDRAEVDLDRLVAGARPLDAAGSGERRLAAAWPAHRARPGPRLLVRLRALSSPAGGGPAPRLCRSHRSPTKHQPHDCDAVWLPGGYPELHAGSAGRWHIAFVQACTPLRSVACRSMASAAVTWCSAQGLVDAARACATRCSACSASRRRLPRRACIWATGARASCATRAPSWSGTNFISPLCCRTTDEPLADIRDAAGAPVRRARFAPRRRHRHASSTSSTPPHDDPGKDAPPQLRRRISRRATRSHPLAPRRAPLQDRCRSIRPWSCR